MHATKSFDRKSGSRNVPRSVAAAAQLLELWVQGRCVLDRPQVDECLLLLFELDRDVADKYDELFVNEEPHGISQVSESAPF